MSIVNSGIDVATESAAKLPRGGHVKRLFDLLAACLLLFALLPLMLFVALAIFSTERGPILYGHDRIGYKGRRFKLRRDETADWDRALAQLLALAR